VSFFEELRRRNVFRVGIAYLVAVWVLIQVADTLLPVVNAPPWIMQALVLASVLGFPLALVLAWFYEWTSEGARAAGDVAAAEAVRFTGRKIDFAIIGLLVIAIGFLLVGRIGTVEPSVAALPFSNESAAEENAEFFANGIHNELLTQLSKINSLTVIGRNSIMEYRDSLKSVREIGQELGVATLLLGQVQRIGNLVRLNVQLIDAEHDRQLWSGAFEDQLTAENIFSIQSQIATAIAGELNAALTPEEVSRLNEVPTRNEQAWLHYQSGLDYASSNDDANAVEQFELAVEDDETFALAWARLAFRRGMRFDSGQDPSEENLNLSLEALDRAQRLAPDLPEVHLALSSRYARDDDRAEALRQLEFASQGLPNDAELYASLAARYRRMGKWQEAIEASERARELDPLNFIDGASWIYTWLRDYSRAEDGIDDALRIRPDSASAREEKARLPLYRDGDVTLAKATLADLEAPLGDGKVFLGWTTALYERNYEEALDYATDMPELLSISILYVPKDSYLGVTQQLAGRPELARSHFQAVRDQLEAAIEDTPGDARARLYVTLAEALLGLDEPEEAVSLVNQAIDLMPRSRDAVTGSEVQKQAIVRVLAPAGEVDMVIEELGDYLDNPGRWSLEGLLPDPRFEPVREHPDFQAFVESRRRR